MSSKPCKLCGRFYENLDERGICVKCLQVNTPRPVYFNREDTNLIPHRNGVIVSREEWNRIKAEVDRYYRYTLDATIELANFKTKDKINNNRNRMYPGYVYLLRSNNGYYKIGRAKNLNSRLSGIQAQYPIAIEIVHYIECRDYKKTECLLHKHFDYCRVGGEWFELDSDSVKWIMSHKTDDSLLRL